jgi:MFS family permease
LRTPEPIDERSHVLRYPDFRALIATRVFASTALQIQAVVVGWQVYSLRHDPLLLGLIGLTEAIPAIGGSFVSGHVVDSSRAARVFRLSLASSLLNALLLLFAAWPTAPLSTDARLVLLFCGVFASGATRSFSTPAVFSIIPRILPRHMMGAGAALNSSSFQIAAIAGPAIGGLAYNWLGGPAAFALPPLLFATSLAASEWLSPAADTPGTGARREPFFKSVAEGLSFALNSKVLLSTMTLDMFSVLFGGAVAVLPVFADKVFAGGPMSLGILRASPSVGSALVALWLAARPMRVISGKTLLLAVAGFGASTIAFALSPHFWLAAFCLAASGAFDGVSMIIRGTLLQLLTPDHMRGRVSAVSSVFITSSNEIGAFESGVAARAMGLISSVVFGGAMTLGIVGVTAWIVPSLARTRIEQRPPRPAA